MEVQTRTPRRLNFDEESQCHTPKIADVDTPRVGMEFESDDHAYHFYNHYGGLRGFGVRKDWVNKNKDNVIRSRRYTCSKEGFRFQKKQNLDVRHPRKDLRTGCSAHMTVSLQTNNRYCVTHFEDEHNHELVTPSKTHLIRSQRKVTHVQGIEVKLASNSGIRPKETYEFMSRQVGGRENLGFLRSDLKNYLFSKREKDMKLGEAGALLYYFQKKQSENPSFQYSIQVDIDDQIANIFWTDAKMRMDYDQFGDVVCFDTTYRTNKECRPFAPFIGVNNHKETVVFGAALLYDETIDSFTWIFQAFLEAMFGKKPKTILTDQDPGMANSILTVFPETHHRLCVWHLYQNALKHLSHVFKRSSSFAKDFKSCIYDYEEEEEFLQSWEAMLEKYDLKENSWLEGIFKERRKWALVYGRHTFCADMKSTQLSESFNSTLKKYLNPTLDVLRFFHHFERVLDDVRYNELVSNHDMSQKIPRLKVDEILLRNARDVFTAKVFEWFQEEFEKSVNLVINQCEENESLVVYKIGIYGKTREHAVSFNSLDDTIFCSCMKFEFVGILCCHVLKVLERRDIKLIPAKYIMKRWTKDATIRNARSYDKDIEVEDPKLAKLNRYKDLCRDAIDVSAMGAETKEDHQFLRRHFQEARLKLGKNSKNIPILGGNTNAPNLAQEKLNEDNPNHIQVKGLKRKEGGVRGGSRLKSGLEVSMKKKRKQNAKPPTPPMTILPTQSPLPFPYVWNDSAQSYASQRLNYGGERSAIPSIYQIPNVVLGQEYLTPMYQPSSISINQHNTQLGQAIAHGKQHVSSQYSQLLQAMDHGNQHAYSSEQA